MSESFSIVFVLFPNVTQLDFTGPYEPLARLPGARITLASVAGGQIVADGGITFAGVQPLSSVEACDLLCVPGGFGTIEAVEDSALLSEVARLASGARFVTSVCTGSLILGAAGLLKGRRAACHWAWRDSLAQFGALADAGRVVRDGNIITGGGVTAGVDMALTAIAEIAGEDFAKTVQLSIEYAPAPPFRSGRPDEAEPHIVALASRRMDRVRSMRDAAMARAAARLSD